MPPVAGTIAHCDICQLVGYACTVLGALVTSSLRVRSGDQYQHTTAQGRACCTSAGVKGFILLPNLHFSRFAHSMRLAVEPQTHRWLRYPA